MEKNSSESVKNWFYEKFINLEVLKRLLKGTTKSPFRWLTVKPSFVRHVLNRQSLAWLHCFAEKLGLL